MDKLPGRPVLISGALGGPFVIYLCTPLRNALTLGSQDRGSGARLLLRKVFRGGPAAGWTGGFAPSVVACPQFVALGPIYHLLHGQFRALGGYAKEGHAVLPSFAAAGGAALCETLLTFGSQSRNAQMAYNNAFVSFSSIDDGARARVPLNKTYQVWGIGAGAMYARNWLAASSVRTLSPWVRERVHLPGLGDNSRAVVCDMFSSMLTCTLTAPMHQLFNFMATTPHAVRLPRLERWELARRFLNRQYFMPRNPQAFFSAGVGALPVSADYSWRISPVALRDFGLRTLYVTTVFTLYMSIERTLCSLMR